MKKLALIAALGLSSLALSSHAATATGTFDVTINLTSACQITSAPTAAFTYTSFQAAAATFASSFNVKCTNTLPYTIALDSTSVTDAATALAYTLALGSTTGTGSGVDQTIAVTGSMAAAQAGTCATSTCTNAASANKQRTLTITY